MKREITLILLMMGVIAGAKTNNFCIFAVVTITSFVLALLVERGN